MKRVEIHTLGDLKQALAAAETLPDTTPVACCGESGISLRSEKGTLCFDDVDFEPED